MEVIEKIWNILERVGRPKNVIDLSKTPKNIVEYYETL